MTGQAQGVAQPPNKPQGKGFFTPNSCCGHSPDTAPAQEQPPEEDSAAPVKSRLQRSCPHQILTWPWEGLALLTHKPGPFSFSNIFTATDWHILGYSAFQNENPGAQTLQSAVLNLTSQVRNTAHNIQTGSTRMDPAKEEEIQWITARCLLHLLLCTHLLQLFEATRSQERVLA